MDCLLINSPDALHSAHFEADPKMPLGILYIASTLEMAGYSVGVVDYHTEPFTTESLESVVRSGTPRLVGLNCHTPNRRSVFDIVNHLKRSFPEIYVIVGGPHATSFPEDLLEHCPELDAVAVGEGEHTVLKLLQSLPAVEHMEGLYTREDFENGAEKTWAPRLGALDSLPFPDFSKIDVPKYLSVSPELYLTCSRGCRYDCAFCSIRTLLGNSIQHRSAENVIREMSDNHSRFGVSRFYFYDDDFIIWPELSRFCTLNALTGLTWTAQATINDLRESSIDALAKGGCYRLSFGFESGSYRVQKYIGKVIKERSLPLISMLSEAGIATRGYFIIGFPGETLDDIVDTLLYIRRLKGLGLSDLAIFPARPYPGTRMWNQCVKLFGAERTEEMLEFYYVQDHDAHASEAVRQKLYRYNTLPTFNLNAEFDSRAIRNIITLAFEMFLENRWLDASRSELCALIKELQVDSFPGQPCNASSAP